MSVYQFNTMTKFLIGAGAGAQVGAKCKEYGCTKVIIVADPFVAEYAAVVKKSLDKVGIGHVTFDGVVPDPTDVSILQAIEIGKAAKVDGVIGIGGGSGLDTAKCVNLLLSNPDKNLADMFDKGGGSVDDEFNLKPGFPMVLIPSTAGTGAESTFGMVLTDTKHGRKMPIRSPRCGHATLAVIDPEVTYSMPPALTAASGMDAIGQAFEGYTACERLTNPISDLLAAEAIKLDYKYLPTVPLSQSKHGTVRLPSEEFIKALLNFCRHFFFRDADDYGVE
jgi:alcohol dehydrogenase